MRAPSGSSSSTSIGRTAVRSSAFSVTFVGSQPRVLEHEPHAMRTVGDRLGLERADLEPRRHEREVEREVGVRRHLVLEP